MSELPKTYEPQAIEEKWYAFWQEQGCFVADPASAKPPYSIVIPPPNVTGVLTLGHVLNNTIQDILARRARMLGKEVLWLPGTDHAGIATQNVVEKSLKKAGEIRHRDDLGREKFLEKVWTWKEKHGGIIIQQLKKLGASCDWSRERFTMDPAYSECVQRVFVDLFQKGLIYRGKRMVNWDPSALTALSDEEVIMKPQKGVLYQFKVEVHGEPGMFLSIATTRPETIPGDTAVAVNPKDARYAHLIGKQVVRPLPLEQPREQRLIPIVGDEHVDFEFGTGVLKVTPAHDKADAEIGQRHGLAAIDIMNPNGTMNALAGHDMAGKDRFEARTLMVERLRLMGLLEKEEPYQNSVGFSERTDVPIEPRLSEQWFLKYPSVAEARKTVLLGRKVEIVRLTGDEIAAPTIHELRVAALDYARAHQIIGGEFVNRDSGLRPRVRRKSLSHAFSNRGETNIKAVAATPELIRQAVHLGSEEHIPEIADIRRVHRFVAALSLHSELFAVHIVAKETRDGTVLYDYKTKKVAPGGESLVPHLASEKLGSQPAPGADVEVASLLGEVNKAGLAFYPERWAKVYDHWLGNIQDWCISRQLWWGHRVPVWSKLVAAGDASEDPKLVKLKKEAAIKMAESFKTADGTSLLDDGDEDFRRETLAGCEEVVQGMIDAMRTAKPGETISLDLSPLNIDQSKPPKVRPPEEIRRVATIDPEEIKALEADGYTQDPDVLDTWFSSWLWPFATMGWPEKTGTLAKFYPTTDLVTGPDIIFFWVARMIMAGFEYMGELPFRNVYFTGLIRDKQGRKMSKSLGNSPDPLDLIAQYGADALRFGIMRGAPLGQDIMFDEKNVELGRNFCTKLWNAARFRQMHGGETEGEINAALLTSDDKWILLRLDSAIAEVTAALEGYQFSEAAQVLYRFFWSEFCDWYLEATKAAIFSGNEELKANTLAVLDFVLAHTLRLFHPFMPFITEELWQGLGYREELPENQGGKTIVYAKWPEPLGADFHEFYRLAEGGEEAATAKYEVVAAGRALRRDANIPSNKKVRFILKATTLVTAHDAEVMKLLLNAEALELPADFTPEKGTPTAHTPLGDLLLPLAGLIDVAAEKTRLAKEIAKVEQELGKVANKLSNDSFIGSAPAAVVEEHRVRQREWQAKLGQLQRMREGL